MNLNMAIGIAVGTFFGNWLLVPFFLPKFRSYNDGFWVGLIAAALALLLCGVIHFFEKKLS